MLLELSIYNTLSAEMIIADWLVKILSLVYDAPDNTIS